MSPEVDAILKEAAGLCSAKDAWLNVKEIISMRKRLVKLRAEITDMTERFYLAQMTEHCKWVINNVPLGRQVISLYQHEDLTTRCRKAVNDSGKAVGLDEYLNPTPLIGTLAKAIRLAVK